MTDTMTLPRHLDAVVMSARKETELMEEAAAVGMDVDRYWDDVTTPDPWHYSFNGATRVLSIGRDRFRFHTWCQRNPKVDVDRGCYSEDAWWEFYHAFVRDEDARDQADTFADALV